MGAGRWVGRRAWSHFRFPMASALPHDHERLSTYNTEACTLCDSAAHASSVGTVTNEASGVANAGAAAGQAEAGPSDTRPTGPQRKDHPTPSKPTQARRLATPALFTLQPSSARGGSPPPLCHVTLDPDASRGHEIRLRPGLCEF